MHFTFLTRCYTPVNLNAIKQNIKDVFKDTEHTYTHLILVDLTHDDQRGQSFDGYEDDVTLVKFVENKPEGDTQNVKGMDNALAELPDDGYIYILDDDNLLHKDFPQVAQYCNGEDAVIFRVDHMLTWGDPQLLKGNPVGRIDWANYVTKLKTMKDLKVYPGGHRCEDGMFFHRMMQHNCTFKFIDKVFAYYNKLPRR